MSRILLVDDEPDTLDVLSTRLCGQDHEVLTARDGVEALMVLDHREVDLMVLDLRMPRMDGLSLLARLRGGATRRPPTVVLTAHGSDALHEAALMQGADAYLTKPFSGRDFDAAIGNLLQAPPRPAVTSTVLLLDDDADFRSILGSRLAGMGYRVEQADRWDQARRLALVERPDVVLLDLGLPEVDGHHVCFDVKHDPRTKDAPVIIVTASTDPLQHEKARLLGADAVLVKPLDWFVLEATIDRLVRVGKPPPAPAAGF